MHASVAQCRFILSTMFERGVAGLDDSHRAIEPQPGAKTAGWIVGHLTVTGDFARKLCGRKSIAPSDWRPLFNPGTTPSRDAATYPPMAALVTKAREVYVDLQDAALAVDVSALVLENPFTPGRAAFPTSGEFLRYMMTGHFAYHCGQLVTWRSAAGLGRIEKWI
jgi:hypothetical protein